MNREPLECWQCPWWGDQADREEPQRGTTRYCWNFDQFRDGRDTCHCPAGVLRATYRQYQARLREED